MMNLSDPVVRARLRTAAPSLLLVALVILVAFVTPGFLTPQTLLEVLADTATLYLLAAGQTFVTLLGGVDLSLQAVASLSSVVLALLVARFGYGAFIAATLVGTFFGVCSGFVHVRLRVPSFVATLATGGVMSGVALLLSDAHAIPIGESGRAYLTVITGSLLGVPLVIWLTAVVLLVGMAVQRFTAFGRYIMAIGAGEAAAWASGVRVERQKILCFVLAGTLAGLAGVVLAARMASGSPMLANELLLPSIAAVVVGGTAVTGGVGGIGRTMIGALIISVVRIGMIFVGVNIFAQQILFGTVLIFAVGITIDRSKILIVK
jgi:ribose transport system permease protein